MSEAEPAISRILLAEDDESLRNFLARALERAGYEVVACADGDAAVEALGDGSYDLLLTDIVMPGADGIEVARIAAALEPAPRIMFITGFAAVALASGQAPQGAKVLSKPVHLREIVAEVERMMAA
jgi:two-component system cell cycle response regulator CpdR